MKALVLESNGNLRYKDIHDPEAKADECLLRVKTAGICNSDIFRAYNNGAYFYPLIMGHEFSGVIEETGTGMQHIKRGDRVAIYPLIPCKSCEYCKREDYAQCVNYDYYGSRRQGGFAQYVAVKEWNLLSIPEEIGFEEAALLEPLAVAIHAVRRFKFKGGDSLAIFGAGVIGLAITKYLSNIINKQNIYIIDHNDFKLSIAKDYGVRTINPLSSKDWLKKLIGDTDGGVNSVIEACGAVETYKQSLEIVKSRGKIIWIGNIHNDLHLEKSLVSSILRREIGINGCWNSRFNHSEDDDWQHALDFIKTARDLGRLITHKVGLEQGPSVFERLYLHKVKGIRDPKESFLKVAFVLE